MESFSVNSSFSKTKGSDLPSEGDFVVYFSNSDRAWFGLVTSVTNDLFFLTNGGRRRLAVLRKAKVVSKLAQFLFQKV